MKNEILSVFSLNYLDADYERAYRIHSKEYTFQILNWLFFYLLLALGIIMSKNLYLMMTFASFRTLAIGIFLFLMITLTKSHRQKNKLHLEVGFCFLVIFLYAIHLMFFFPPLFGKINSKNLFYLSTSLESFRLFLFISKMKWVFVVGTSLFLNYLQFTMLVSDYDSNSSNQFLIIFAFILMNTLPFIAYYQEKNFKILFHQNMCFDQSLKCYEELIKKNLPNQIFILNQTKTKIFFCNDEVENFYNTHNYEHIFDKFKKISISNSNIISILGQTEPVAEKCSFLNYQTSINGEKDGEEYFFDLKLGQILWQNEKAYLVLMSDISAIKQVKKLKELDAYKDQLLATVSHDLRTPLNGLIGVLEILLEKIQDREQRKFLKIASRCSNLLLFMINDILDFSQITHGKLRLFFSKYKISDITTEISSLIKFQCHRKNINFKVEIPLKLRRQKLNCDYRRVQQVLLNLVSNSLKFTSKGHIKLLVNEIIVSRKRFIEFKVEDTGIGIKDSDKSKLFQLFSKIDLQNPTMNHSGVGLGLVISMHLVQLLSGDPDSQINIESKFEKGSVFSFKLPLDLLEDEEIDEELSEKEGTIYDSLKSHRFAIKSPNLGILEKSSACLSPKSPTKSNFPSLMHKILLVDDDQINLYVIGKYLEIFGLNFETASDGKTALKSIMKEQNYTLILMDCNMPIMNGFEATKKIKELAKKNPIFDIPILALTANTSNQDIDLCKQSGMNDYLAKPVSKQEMKEKLQQILKIKI